MQDAIGQAAALEAAHPGAVSALEGPNEIQPRFAYGGETGLAAGVRFIADMRAAARADPALRSKPIVSFTSFQPIASDCDYANHHPYPKNGDQPGALILLRRDQWVGQAGVMPGKPIMFTEFGYHTLVGKPGRPGEWQGVDETTQAILLLNGLFDAASDGVARTYLYQLFDGRPDQPGQPNMQNHFGLYRLDGTPKPAAKALHNLATLLDDRSPLAGDFAVAPPPIRVESAAPVRVLPLRKSNGETWLALWIEPALWDKATMTALRPAPVQVRLTGPKGRATAWDILSLRPVISDAPLVSARIDLGAWPLIVKCA
jgi:hypothetical protein